LRLYRYLTIGPPIEDMRLDRQVAFGNLTYCQLTIILAAVGQVAALSLPDDRPSD